MNKEVPNRVSNISRGIHFIKNICDQIGLQTKFHTLAEPTVADIHRDIKSFEARIKFDEIQEEPYKKLTQPLTLQELSNYEKHRLAFATIANGSMDDLHLVVEDDIHMLPMMEQGWKEILNVLLSNQSKPFVVLSLANELQSSTSNHLVPFESVKTAIIPSKEAYFINPNVAKTLFEYTQTIRMHMRNTLSYWINKNIENTFIPSKRISFDGSKLGIFPSTVHSNNILVFNQEYMQMLKMLSEPEKDISKIHKTYKIIERLQSPDAMHLYAVLLYQGKRHDEASEYFRKAVDEMVSQKGLITRQSELLQNSIEFYKSVQESSLSFTSPCKYENYFKKKPIDNQASSPVSSSVVA